LLSSLFSSNTSSRILPRTSQVFDRLKIRSYKEVRVRLCDRKLLNQKTSWTSFSPSLPSTIASTSSTTCQTRNCILDRLIHLKLNPTPFVPHPRSKLPLPLAPSFLDRLQSPLNHLQKSPGSRGNLRLLQKQLLRLLRIQFSISQDPAPQSRHVLTNPATLLRE